MSYPTLQPLLLPTNQLTSEEEEGKETERGGKKAVRDGGKTLNLRKTVAHLFFLLCLAPGWHTLLFAAGLGEHRMLFPIYKKKPQTNKKLLLFFFFFRALFSQFPPTHSMLFYSLHSILKNKGAGDPHPKPAAFLARLPHHQKLMSPGTSLTSSFPPGIS